MAEPELPLRLLDRSGCVVAWFAGDDHAGGYAHAAKEITDVTLKGMIQAPGRNAYSLLELYPDQIRMTGVGAEPSRELKYPTHRSTRWR